MTAAVAGTTQVCTSIGTVVVAANHTDRSAGDVLTAARDLSYQAAELDRRLHTFIEKMRQ